MINVLLSNNIIFTIIGSVCVGAIIAIIITKYFYHKARDKRRQEKKEILEEYRNEISKM